VEGTKKEGDIPQTEADFVRKAVERIKGGVSDKVIRLRDRCRRESFALFVSNFVSTDEEEACGYLARRGSNTHKITNSHASSASLM